jgi:hypothetical protein
MIEELKNTIYWSQKIFALANNYLSSVGWFNQKPINGNGPTPWFTYPAISFVDDILTEDMKVFEYGAGYSTMYFANCVREVKSVDHNMDWVNHISEVSPKTSVVFCGEDAEPLPAAQKYVEEFMGLNFECPVSNNRSHNIEHGLLNLEFAKYASQVVNWDVGYFDVIVVDGMARALSGYIASKFIADDGYIILDNSDRWQYNSLQEYLISQGFGRIDFWGAGPVNAYGWCTSVFSKSFKLKNKKIKRENGCGDLGW